MDFRSRDQWGASYDVSRRPLMSGLPVGQAFIHHTVTAPSGDPNADMAEIERIDIARFGVPSYSYVIHPSGTVLEGMGNHRGAHTMNNNGGPGAYGYNDIAFGLSFIGNFQDDQPTSAAILAASEMLATLVAFGQLRSDFTLLGHRDVYATACCGDNLYPQIPAIRAAADHPPTKDGFLMALSDEQQGDLYTTVKQMANMLNTSVAPAVGRIELYEYADAHKAGTPLTVNKDDLVAAIQAAGLTEAIAEATAEAIGKKLVDG